MPLLPVNAAGESPRPVTRSAISPAPPRFARRPPVRVRRSAVLAATLAAVLAMPASVIPGVVPARGADAAGCPSSLQAL